MKFKAVSTDKGLKYFKYIKGFFGKEKLKEVSEKEVFAPLKISKQLFPDIENLTLDDILFLKHDYNIKNHLSDFDCEVNFEIENYEDKLIETKDGYTGEVTFDGTIKNSKKNVPICSFTINTNVINNKFKPTQRFYEKLFTNTYSGVYGSLKNVDELFDSMEVKDKWYCETCGEIFENRLEFLSHLIETKHYDSIFDEYLHDKDVLFVKNQRNSEDA